MAAGTAPAGTQRLPAQWWDVAGVAADGRAIDVFYSGGGCRRQAHATAQETASSVTISVLQDTFVPEPGSNVACTADLFRGLTQVKLAAPLGGRSIKGRPAPTPGGLQTLVFEGYAVAKIRVPRLVGLSPWEAKRALRLRGLAASIRNTRGTGGLAQVVGQAPAPGGAVAKGTTIRLHIARRR